MKVLHAATFHKIKTANGRAKGRRKNGWGVFRKFTLLCVFVKRFDSKNIIIDWTLKDGVGKGLWRGGGAGIPKKDVVGFPSF